MYTNIIIAHTWASLHVARKYSLDIVIIVNNRLWSTPWIVGTMQVNTEYVFNVHAHLPQYKLSNKCSFTALIIWWLLYFQILKVQAVCTAKCVHLYKWTILLCWALRDFETITWALITLINELITAHIITHTSYTCRWRSWSEWELEI